MAPKPKGSPAAPTVGVKDLFTSLNRHIQRSEYEQGVKVSDQILAAVPGDEDAICCKVVALIKADSIEEALVAIEECSRKAPIDLSFFKAYCLYRQNKLEQALEFLKGQKGSTASMLLESQILYRLGKMEASVDRYQHLRNSMIDSLEINLVAGLVSAGRASDVQGTLDSLRVKATSSFELAHNTACSLIERHKYKDADQLLLSARRIGQETLMEENFADDEVEIELAPIAVQLAYVQLILGNTQEAIASYTNLVKRNLADESSLPVAINNLIALKGPKDVSGGLRKLDKLIVKSDEPQKFQLAHGLDLKLSQKQREAIYTNRVLLLLHSHKMDQAREVVAVLPELFPVAGLHLIQRGGFQKRKDLVTDQTERIREQLKLEVLREQWLKWQRFVMIPNQTSQSIPKEPLRMQASNTPSLHRDQERDLGSNQRSIHHFLIEDSKPIRHICMVPLESSPSLFHKLHLIRTVVIQRPRLRILRGLNYKGLDTERHGVVLCDIFARICHIGGN